MQNEATLKMQNEAILERRGPNCPGDENGPARSGPPLESTPGPRYSSWSGRRRGRSPRPIDRGVPDHDPRPDPTSLPCLDLCGLIVLATGPGEALAQAGQEWVGQRVITKFGATLQVDGRVIDDEKLVNSARGGQRKAFRIYRVEQVNGPWLWVKAEGSGVAGWVTANWLIPFDQAIDYFTNEIRAIPATLGLTSAGLSSGATRRNTTSPSPTSTRRSGSTPGMRLATTIAASPGASRRSTTAPSPTTARRSGSTPRTRWPTTTAASPGSDKGDHDRAIADYDEAIRLDPKDAMAYHESRHRLARQEGATIARSPTIYEAIRLDPKDRLAYLNRGNAWHAKKDFDHAIADYDEAIRLDPE